MQKSNHKEKPLKKGLDYVKSLAVGKGKVPVNDLGKGALVEQKYL
jgi:hypothetical protein